MASPNGRPLRTRVLRVVATAAALVAGSLLARAHRAARNVPLSPLTAGRRVGAGYVDRRGIASPPHPRGEVDDLATFAGRDFDPESVHPAVRRFYEETAAHAMAYRVTWHSGFRTGAALASLLTGRIGQLSLPGRGHADPRPLRSRIVGLDPAADPRDGARAWIRTDEAGDAVFVALYATHERAGRTYTNIAVPLPASNLSTVLGAESFDAGADGDGVRLTTQPERGGGRSSGDEGLYLVTPVGSFALPLDQTFEVWPAGSPGAPTDITGGRASVVASHEMRIYGRRFLTVEYACWVEDGADN